MPKRLQALTNRVARRAKRFSYNKTEVLAGDWYCTAVSCGAHNYASRPNCFRCGAFKSVYPGDYGAYMMGSDQYGSDASIPPGWKSGDWVCHYFPAFDFRRNTFNLSGKARVASIAS